MAKRAAELEAEVARWMNAAAMADAKEDKTFGGDKSGEEMPDWVADKKRRAEKIRAAQAELEAEAKALAEAKAKAQAEAEEKRKAEGRKKSGQTRRPALRQARSESAKELHRPRKPHHENQGRLPWRALSLQRLGRAALQSLRAART